MDVWMLARGDIKDDLLGLFAVLGGLQYQYDWIVTSHDLWYSAGCPEAVKKRWQWTGLLISGQELTEHLRAGYIYIVMGCVLSAVPLGTKAEQVNRYEPTWEVSFESPDYRFQTPLTQLEIMCFDGEAWVIICDAAFSLVVRAKLPTAKTPEAFWNNR